MVSNRLTTPVDLIFGIPTNTYIVWRERKSISLKVVIPLSIMMLAGIIPGTLLLTIFLSPAVLLGMIIGIKVDSNMKEKTVKKSVIALLIISGMVLLVKKFFYY